GLIGPMRPMGNDPCPTCQRFTKRKIRFMTPPPIPPPRGLTGRVFDWLFPPLENEMRTKHVLVAPEAAALLRTLSELALHLWRMHRKMIDPTTGEPCDEMSGPFRQVEAMWETLQAAHI